MENNTNQDVPSPIDLTRLDDAKQWAEEANAKRPYRKTVFERIALELKEAGASSVLELGSGPGHLAHAVLSTNDQVQYSAFDNSPAMHSLARENLRPYLSCLQFVLGSFKEKGWSNAFKSARFDAVITTQAVHELRHKAYTVALFKEVKKLLQSGSVFLYCDHVCDSQGMSNDQLFMNEAEQQTALEAADFVSVEKLLRMGSLALWRART